VAARGKVEIVVNQGERLITHEAQGENFPMPRKEDEGDCRTGTRIPTLENVGVLASCQTSAEPLRRTGNGDEERA
jgi:hypothetical protein